MIWNYLAEDLGREQVLLGERITAQNLYSMWKKDQAVVHVVDNRIIGYTALWDTPHPIWLELGTVWVHEHYRGNKIASDLFLECTRKLREGMRMFTITHNPKVMHLAKKAGFSEAKDEETWFSIPREITCTPCDRIPISGQRLCSMRTKQNKCTLFFV
ncbi:MAG: GNAT family N-acetyltransferase [Candidatus Pacebacteria bacterium]|nr:GNAT family N-acetyltransferase [Candidatus Paceibacterota bacterium]